MDSLRSMLRAYLYDSLTTDDFADQFIEFWNDIRIEQNKAIETSGIRQILDDLWNQYKTGKLTEIEYGMQWTEILTQLENVRISPQSIVFSMGNDLYSQLTLVKEHEYLDSDSIPTRSELEEQCLHLLESVDA